HWLGEQFLSWRLQIVAAEPGVMQQETMVKGVVTRQEIIIKAPADGLVLQITAAGERVPAGTELIKLGVVSQAEIQAMRGSEGQEPDKDLWRQLISYWQQIFASENEGKAEQNEETDNNTQQLAVDGSGENAFEEILTICNEHPGYISYYIDGWEAYNGPLYLSGEEYDQSIREGIITTEGDLVVVGQPIIKVVDNWHWFFNVVLPLYPGRLVAELPVVEIVFNFAPYEPVQADLYCFEIDEPGHEVRLTFIIEKQLAGFDQARWAEASLIYRRREGIIVPAEAVFEKDLTSGVYLNQGGRVVFAPVAVLEKQEEKIMVDGIAPFNLVISRPELVEEGQRLN
ncbi:MAG: hypothetical protein MUP57_04290, partial [Clostridia bacterium]|nr:hypothetical protein [Clostridia bacterium]